MNERPKQIWFRVGQLCAVAALGVLGVADLHGGLAGFTGLHSPTFLGAAEVGCALAAAGVWLPAHRQGSRLLPALATLVAVCSLLIVASEARREGAGSVSWGLAETAALLGLLFVVARRSAAWHGVVGCLTVAAAITVQPLSYDRGETEVSLSLILALFSMGAVASGTFVRLIERGREYELAAARSDQRAEFARDLHDFIAHHVAGIVVQAQGARFIATQDPQRVITALEEIEKAGAETMSSMRRMVRVLRTDDEPGQAALAPIAGIAELDTLVGGFPAAGGPAAQLSIEGRTDDLPIEVTSSVYRVVMEALTNVRRHAPRATNVHVVVQRTPDWVLVRIANDGPAPRGGPPRDGHGEGFGLLGLTERVRALGGRLQAGPGIDSGWVVDAALPLGRDSEAAASMSR